MKTQAYFFEEFSVRVSKAAFVQQLQSEDKFLSPHDISQRIRLQIARVSICRLDTNLNTARSRGYMIRPANNPYRSPENPDLYVCIVSAQQSQAWQYTVWTKEILHIFDDASRQINTREPFVQMLGVRATTDSADSAESPGVTADKNGLILAIGSMVPQRYRTVLRNEKYLEKYSLETLEQLLFIPREKIEYLLSEHFEDDFQSALANCDEVDD